MPTLSLVGKTFVLRCSFAERELARNNKFLWDGERRVWFTKDLAVAAKLRDYAIGDAKTYLAKSLLTVSPWPMPLPPPPNGLTIYPHQERAVRFALERNRSYLALAPGLGKTIIAALIARALKQRILYIAPPFLVENVRNEFERWNAGRFLHLVPDSMLHRPETLAHISEILEKQFISTLIVDEAHRFKNPDAKRTQALFGSKKVGPGLIPHFERQIYLSGTPMPNRPMELFPLLSKVAPETIDFMNYFQFGRRYCAGFESLWGWDFSGASNMQELNRRIVAPSGSFMLRQAKDVLDLPPKIEEIFVMARDMPARLHQLDDDIGKSYAKVEDLIKHQLATSAGIGADDLHLATYRRLLGVEKAKAAVDYLKALLDETDENIIVFAYHKDAIAALEKGLKAWSPLVITGETPVGDRQAIVDEFQGGLASRVIIGNYVAMGVGFTLTAATRVIFVEFSWVPGENDQASDRAHRIGQNETVLVQYLIYKDSVDKLVIETLLRKRKALFYI